MRFLLFTVFTVVVSTTFAQRQAWLHPQLEQRLATEKTSHIHRNLPKRTAQHYKLEA